MYKPELLNLTIPMKKNPFFFNFAQNIKIAQIVSTVSGKAE